MKKVCFALTTLSMVLFLYACGEEAPAQAPQLPCADGHQWVEASCETPKTCSVCQASVGEPEHCWQPAACDTVSTCSICGITAGKAIEHTFSDWVVDADERLFRYCYLCGQEDAYVLADEVYTDTLYEQTKEFFVGTWTAKLVVDDTNSQYSLPQEQYSLDIQLKKNEEWSWLEWEASFVDKSPDIIFGQNLKLEYSERSQYAVLYTDENGQPVNNGMPQYMSKLLSEMICSGYTIQRVDEINDEGVHIAKTVLYDMIVYYTPEFPNGLMEVVMHEEQQRVFFTKDDPDHPGVNPFCKIITD